MSNEYYNLDENDLEDFQDFEEFYGLDQEDEELEELNFEYENIIEVPLEKNIIEED